MYNIETKGYESKEKITIAKDYLIPKIEEQIKIGCESIKITDEVFKHIIDTYTNNEKGVRNLKRCIEIIYTKLNLYRLMKPESKLFSQEIISNVKFPFEVSRENVDSLIKIQKDQINQSVANMYL